MARDVALSLQPEIGELAEPAAAGRGGSSSMPHKRNPAGCLLALEAARRAPGLAATLLNQMDPEHERGLGHWQSQWLTLRELACAGASALAGGSAARAAGRCPGDARQPGTHQGTRVLRGSLVAAITRAGRQALRAGDAGEHASAGGHAQRWPTQPRDAAARD